MHHDGLRLKEAWRNQASQELEGSRIKRTKQENFRVPDEDDVLQDDHRKLNGSILHEPHY